MRRTWTGSAAAAGSIDIVDVFRRSEAVAALLPALLAVRPKLVWLQLVAGNTKADPATVARPGPAFPFAAINADAEVRRYYYPSILSPAEMDELIDAEIDHLHRNGFGFLAATEGGWR